MQQITIGIYDHEGKSVQEKSDFISFSVNSSLDHGVDTFSVTLIDPEFKIKTGYYLAILTNPSREMMYQETLIFGIIQRKDTIVNKDQLEVTLSGKNAISLLVESYCILLKDYTNKTPKQIVDALIDQTSFKVRYRETPTIQYGFPDVDSTDDQADYQKFLNYEKKANQKWVTFGLVTYGDEFSALPAVEYFKITAGDTVFSKISEIVTLSGYEVLFQRDGFLYIGDLKTIRDEAGVVFTINHNRNDSKNNILSASLSEDISDRYREIGAYSQNEDGTNRYVKVTDATAPSTAYQNEIEAKPGPEKSMVITVPNDQDPLKLAIELRESQRIDGFQLNYTVPGVSQNQKMYEKNRKIKVNDSIMGISGVFVITGVNTTFDLNGGLRTDLTLSLEKDHKTKNYPPIPLAGVELVG